MKQIWWKSKYVLSLRLFRLLLFALAEFALRMVFVYIQFLSLDYLGEDKQEGGEDLLSTLVGSEFTRPKPVLGGGARDLSPQSRIPGHLFFFFFLRPEQWWRHKLPRQVPCRPGVNEPSYNRSAHAEAEQRRERTHRKGRGGGEEKDKSENREEKKEKTRVNSKKEGITGRCILERRQLGRSHVMLHPGWHSIWGMPERSANRHMCFFFFFFGMCAIITMSALRAISGGKKPPKKNERAPSTPCLRA